MNRVKHKRTGKKNNFIESLRFLASSKNFIIAIAIMFAAFLLLGVIYPHLMTDVILDMINSLANQTQNKNFFQLAGFIIFNNVKASLFGLLFGVLFGIFPLFLAAVNGYVLGFILNAAARTEGLVEIWKIFPHGVFELPAFFFSLGLGVRLGYTLFTEPKMLNSDFKMCLKTFVYIILPLLLVAGLIETGLIFLLKPIA
jgi:stage II sporulation protein M